MKSMRAGAGRKVEIPDTDPPTLTQSRAGEQLVDGQPKEMKDRPPCARTAIASPSAPPGGQSLGGYVIKERAVHPSPPSWPRRYGLNCDGNNQVLKRS